MVVAGVISRSALAQGEQRAAPRRLTRRSARPVSTDVSLGAASARHSAASGTSSRLVAAQASRSSATLRSTAAIFAPCAPSG